LIFRNQLESFYLAALDFDVSIKASTYVSKYFQLRDSVNVISRPWALQPIKRHIFNRLFHNGDRVIPSTDNIRDDNGARSSIVSEKNPPSNLTAQQIIKIKNALNSRRAVSSDLLGGKSSSKLAFL
jgi:hypothetical protein